MIKHWFFNPVPCLEDESKVKESSNKSTGSNPEEANSQIKSTKGDFKNEIKKVDKKEDKEISNSKTSSSEHKTNSKKDDKDSEKKSRKNSEKSNEKSDDFKKKSKKNSGEKSEESKKKPSTEVDFLPSNDLANDKTYKRVLRQTHVDKYKLKVVREEKKVVREELLNEKIKAEIDEIRSRIPSKSP